MKKFLIIFLCFSAVLCFAQDNLDANEKKLLKQQKKIAKEMFDLRVKLLQKDPHLKKIHAKIMELHQELALMLDRKKEMQKLAVKYKKVKEALETIQDQKSMNEEDEEEEEE